MRWAAIDAASWTTLRARLTLWNTAAVLLMTGSALFVVWFGGRAALYREADAVLRGNAREIAIAIKDLHPDIDAIIDEMRRKAVSHEERGWFTQLLTAGGVTLWKSDLCPAEVANKPPTDHDRLENIIQIGQYRYARVAVNMPGQASLHVRIGMSTEFLDSSVNAILGLLFPLGIALLLFTPLAGYWLAVRATKPIANILQTAERLRPTRLGDRLAVTGSRDELDRLSTTINNLLDQVAAHVDHQERFVADAAHELRGPLAAIQSSLEVAMSEGRSEDAHRETLADVLDATRHLSKLANDLLILAELADSDVTLTREPVDLTRVTKQAVGMFAGVSEERGIDLVFSGNAMPLVCGEPVRIRQVISNLLDNALRFTPPGGKVTVTVAAAGAEGVLVVHDTGSGIAPDHLERVFDRFYKADPSRSHGETPRSGGLGLAICKSLIEVSGGSITMTSELGVGTEVIVRLPFFSPAASAANDLEITTAKASG